MRKHLNLTRIDAYVALVAIVAVPALLGSAFLPHGQYLTGSTVVGRYWGPFILTLVAFLLEVTSRRSLLRGGGGTGSISFVAYFAALVLFGPFWSVVIAGSSTLLAQLFTKQLWSRVFFNTSQKILSASLAGAVYSSVGGSALSSFMGNGSEAPFDALILSLGAFFLAGFVYFATNSYLVSWAVSISTGTSFSEVWKKNTLWVLGYDIASSAFALGVAWIYTIFENGSGLSRLGFPAIFLPIIAVRHVYVQLNELQTLYDRLDASKDELEKNVREQLEMMVRSIEARDPYTSGHSRRVAAISEALALDYGLSAELVADIKNAALLHDVGKIHAEFAPLLSKDGKLNAEEWEIMKSHSTKSAELVGLFSKFRGFVQDSVLHHHERWDGLGYPAGRAGEAIPIGSRVIMIADTIDAMTTDRPYRKALGWEVVVAELGKHRGRQFDPSLVDCAVGSVSLRRMVVQGRTEPASSAVEGTPPIRSHSSIFSSMRLSEMTGGS